jgi:hypothetical protein
MAGQQEFSSYKISARAMHCAILCCADLRQSDLLKDWTIRHIVDRFDDEIQ